ncbi:MAG TPA: hypothetical protein VHL98_21325 [Microvirga sp.]|jgi:Ca2+-binding RTX toxin-like protein|nr:hypothetical protein [Microvirga sp.]
MLNGGNGKDRLEGGIPTMSLIGKNNFIYGEGGDDDLWALSDYSLINGGSGDLTGSIWTGLTKSCPEPKEPEMAA